MQVLRSRVLLRPRDLEVSLAFYEDALGLHRSREFGDGEHRGVVFFLGGAELELTASGDDEVPSMSPGVRLWLQVPDVDLALRRAAAAGVRPTEESELKTWGLIEAVVHDPDGLPIVLVEVPPGHPLRTDTREL